MDWIGRTIAGRYRVVERIGKGGMGVVWHARDERLARDVALKVLLHEDDAAAVERFKVEARAAAALSDPRIVTVHDFGDEDGFPFIVMELLSGHTLRDELQGRGRIAWQKALAVVGDIARALDVAHRGGVVHRDLKPENVFLVDGKLERIKILDFGLARLPATTTSASPERLTQAGTFVGTPGYVAPETVLQGVVDARADLYALGVLAFELLTGEPPYRAQTQAALILTHATAPIPAPSSLVADIPAAVDSLVVKLLAKDPALRTPSAAALVFDLDSAGDDTDPGSRAANVRGLSPSAATETANVTPTIAAPAPAAGAAPLGARPRHRTFVAASIVAIVVVIFVAVVVIAPWLASSRTSSTSITDVRRAVAGATKVVSLAMRADVWTVSPDGASIIVDVDDGWWLIDTATRSRRRPPTPPKCNLDELYYRADGRLVVNCIEGKSSTVWDLDPRTNEAHVIAHDFAGMAPSPVDDRIAASSSALGAFVADGSFKRQRQLVEPTPLWVWTMQWATPDAIILVEDERTFAVSPTDPRRAALPSVPLSVAGIGDLITYATPTPNGAVAVRAISFDDLLAGRAPAEVTAVRASHVSLAGGARVLSLAIANATRVVTTASFDGEHVGDFRRLTLDDADAISPQFLDASTILFGERRDDHWALFSQRIDSGEATALGGVGTSNLPASALDGGVVYWASADGDADARLLVRKDGVHDREIARVPRGQVFVDVNGPGAPITVSCGGGVCALGRIGSAGGTIDVIDAATGKVVERTDAAAVTGGGVRMSRDGSKIAVIDVSLTRSTNIRVFDRATKQWSTHTVVEGNAPAWGPSARVIDADFLDDNTLIAVVFGEQSDGHAVTSFVKVPLAGGAPVTMPSTAGTPTHIAVAPGGASIAESSASWTTDLLLAQLR